MNSEYAVFHAVVDLSHGPLGGHCTIEEAKGHDAGKLGDN